MAPPPRRTRPLLVGAVGLSALALLGGALWLGSGGAGGAGADAAPAPSAAPTPTPSATPTLTPEEQAEAEIEVLLERFVATTTRAYRDPSTPVEAIHPYAVDPIRGVWAANVAEFRQQGSVMESGGLTAEGVEVEGLTLEPPLPMADVTVCSVIVAEVLRNGQRESWNERTISRYRVAQTQQSPIRWVLVDSSSPTSQTC
jgi:hypothetical protein